MNKTMAMPKSQGELSNGDYDGTKEKEEFHPSPTNEDNGGAKEELSIFEKIQKIKNDVKNFSSDDDNNSLSEQSATDDYYSQFNIISSSTFGSSTASTNGSEEDSDDDSEIQLDHLLSSERDKIDEVKEDEESAESPVDDFMNTIRKQISDVNSEPSESDAKENQLDHLLSSERNKIDEVKEDEESAQSPVADPSDSDADGTNISIPQKEENKTLLESATEDTPKAIVEPEITTNSVDTKGIETTDIVVGDGSSSEPDEHIVEGYDASINQVSDNKSEGIISDGGDSDIYSGFLDQIEDQINSVSGLDCAETVPLCLSCSTDQGSMNKKTCDDPDCSATDRFLDLVEENAHLVATLECNNGTKSLLEDDTKNIFQEKSHDAGFLGLMEEKICLVASLECADGLQTATSSSSDVAYATEKDMSMEPSTSDDNPVGLTSEYKEGMNEEVKEFLDTLKSKHVNLSGHNSSSNHNEIDFDLGQSKSSLGTDEYRVLIGSDCNGDTEVTENHLDTSASFHHDNLEESNEVIRALQSKVSIGSVELTIEDRYNIDFHNTTSRDDSAMISKSVSGLESIREEEENRYIKSVISKQHEFVYGSFENVYDEESYVPFHKGAWSTRSRKKMTKQEFKKKRQWKLSRHERSGLIPELPLSDFRNFCRKSLNFCRVNTEKSKTPVPTKDKKTHTLDNMDWEERVVYNFLNKNTFLSEFHGDFITIIGNAKYKKLFSPETSLSTDLFTENNIVNLSNGRKAFMKKKWKEEWYKPWKKSETLPPIEYVPTLNSYLKSSSKSTLFSSRDCESDLRTKSTKDRYMQNTFSIQSASYGGSALFSFDSSCGPMSSEDENDYLSHDYTSHDYISHDYLSHDNDESHLSSSRSALTNESSQLTGDSIDSDSRSRSSNGTAWDQEVRDVINDSFGNLNEIRDEIKGMMGSKNGAFKNKLLKTLIDAHEGNYHHMFDDEDDCSQRSPGVFSDFSENDSHPWFSRRKEKINVRYEPRPTFDLLNLSKLELHKKRDLALINKKNTRIGNIQNTFLVEGERVSRVSPTVTSSLWKSKWRKHYFGTMPC